MIYSGVSVGILYVYVLMRLGKRYCCFFFFFKQKTAYEMRISDWSSDVCSSDLPAAPGAKAQPPSSQQAHAGQRHDLQQQRYHRHLVGTQHVRIDADRKSVV